MQTCISQNKQVNEVLLVCDKLKSYLSVSLSVGDEWYLCWLTLTLPNLSDVQWAMFPYPYLAAVGPDTGAGSVVYKLVARSGDGSVGTAHFLLVDGGFDGQTL